MPTPFDPYCGRYARDMTSLDFYISETEEEYQDFLALGEDAKGVLRERYIRNEEGTYNPSNGHFACDACYIRIGMPSSSAGWVAP